MCVGEHSDGAESSCSQRLLHREKELYQNQLCLYTLIRISIYLSLYILVFSEESVLREPSTCGFVYSEGQKPLMFDVCSATVGQCNAISHGGDSHRTESYTRGPRRYIIETVFTGEIHCELYRDKIRLILRSLNGTSMSLFSSHLIWRHHKGL